MIIIRMKGGLGNQMFQYALYRELEYLGRDVKMDDVTGFRDDPQRQPALDLFHIDYRRASEQEVLDLTDGHMDFKSRIMRKFRGRKTLEVTEIDGNFNPEIFKMKDAYLNGYWQTDQYFPDAQVVAALKKDFAMDSQTVLHTAESWSIFQRIGDTESVSIHIRRGDYLEPGTIETFGGICTEEYYHKAMEELLKVHPSAVFFVFTNDKQWCAEHMEGDRIFMVDTGEAPEHMDLADMFLMSQCRHHILANSSFSWWSAWLNDNPRKTVIAPAKWLNNKAMVDIYTSRMVKISLAV